MLIDAEDPATYPVALKDAILKYISSNLASVEDEIKAKKVEYDKDVRCAIEDYLKASKAKTLHDDLKQLVADKQLVCYHATKVLHPDRLAKNGLHPNEWKTYETDLRETLIELNAPDVDSAINLVREEHERKSRSSGGKGRICFFSGISLADTSNYNKFCENIGGELAGWALENYSGKSYQLLKENGVPIIVKFCLLISDIENCEGILNEFVNYYSAEHFWNWNYSVQFSGIVHKCISPKQILELIHYE